MEKEDVKHVAIGEWEYDAVRESGDWRGYIELRQRGGGPPVARITCPGPARPMELTTYGASLPRPVAEWLFERADWSFL